MHAPIGRRGAHACELADTAIGELDLQRDDVARIGRRLALEQFRVDLGDRPCDIDQRIDQMQARTGQPAPGRLVRIVAPAARGDAGRMFVGEMRLDMQDLADRPVGDHPAQGRHRREAALVVAEREHDTRFLDRRDRAPGLGKSQCKRLFAPHMFSRRRDRRDLVDVQRVRRGQHDGFHPRVGERVVELGRERESVGRRKVADLLGLLAHPADEAQALALALHRRNDALAPASKADNGCVDHVSAG